MHCLSRLLRANTTSSSLRVCRPNLVTPPYLVYPTKPARSFSATPIHSKFVVPKRKQQVTMPSDMTTFKGKPFDRASLESVMKVCACIPPTRCAASSHIDHHSDDSFTHPPSTSMAVSLVSTTMARPVPPSQTTLSTYGGSTLC